MDEGLSLAEIGRRVGLHESTVGYWVAKHGLEAANRARVAPKGGLAKAELAPMVEAGMSAGAIAVRETPSMLGQIDAAALARDLAEHMAEWDEALPLERRLMHVAATMACQARCAPAAACARRR